MERFPQKGVKLVRQGYVFVDRFDSPRSVIDALQSKFCDYAQELVFALYLDSSLRPLHYSIISQGSLNGAVVNPADIFRIALVSGASKVILLHNHPSGFLNPSTDDISLTSRLIEAGDLLGVEVLDHIIFGPMGYFSMRERDMISHRSCKYSKNLQELSFSKCAENFIF